MSEGTARFRREQSEWPTTNPNSQPIYPHVCDFVQSPLWIVQKCPICDGKGYVWSGLPTLTPDKCTFCNGKKAIMVSSYGTIKEI